MKQLRVWYLSYEAVIGSIFATGLTEIYDDYSLAEPAIRVPGTPTDWLPQEEDDVQIKETPTGYTCSLCIYVDHQFVDAYTANGKNHLNNLRKVKASIKRMVEHANWIFRSTDWDNDGKPDNIGFNMASLVLGWLPFREDTQDTYEIPKEASGLLKIFARMNFSTCCLGVGFTNRPFLNGLDAISFAAADKILGGICDHRDPKEDLMRSMNAVLISARAEDQSQLPLRHMSNALLHELGHAFGARLHDDEFKAPGCWGFQLGEADKPPSKPKLGRYIMWPKSSLNPNQLTRRNNVRFSTCSKTAIALVIDKRKQRKKCFDVDDKPFCGNGIVEGLETCDCGSFFDCSKQKCCGSRSSRKPCMIMDTISCNPNGFSKQYGGNSEVWNSASCQLNPKYQIVVIFLMIKYVKLKYFGATTSHYKM
ncbi:unnamed protein product [Orchesella dallaii]|uniref:Peptidase M12B domain-containing protein n=1 Tax=Orchesella dallaii TaxID=48710 RepID=A0ABP1QKG6_9HEXA